mmetsp:Transcript_113509/g.326333  ORF Transcript_113509/g.326333 Transcript_113509/m.326333 type:complete len:109 (-) Transcript_113509:152-478(-)
MKSDKNEKNDSLIIVCKMPKPKRKSRQEWKLKNRSNCWHPRLRHEKKLCAMSSIPPSKELLLEKSRPLVALLPVELRIVSCKKAKHEYYTSVMVYYIVHMTNQDALRN